MNTFAFVGRSPWHNAPKQDFLGLMSEWNGYVAVEKDLDPADCDYDKLNDLLGDDCPHGGVTFAEFGYNIPKEVLNNYEQDNDLININWDDYVIYGFDTLHYGDNRDMWPKDKVFFEAEYFEQNLINLINSL